jgi:hypothetical protein
MSPIIWGNNYFGAWKITFPVKNCSLKNRKYNWLLPLFITLIDRNRLHICTCSGTHQDTVKSSSIGTRTSLHSKGNPWRPIVTLASVITRRAYGIWRQYLATQMNRVAAVLRVARGNFPHPVAMGTTKNIIRAPIFIPVLWSWHENSLFNMNQDQINSGLYQLPWSYELRAFDTAQKS